MARESERFIREIEIESRNVILRINQYELGDVGCVVWDAGLVLAKYIDHLNVRCNTRLCFLGKNVLDIGSGTGVVGLVAAVVGGSVILTDLPELLPLLELNINENADALIGTVKAEVLTWGEINGIHQPDILLVGDCIYYEKSLMPLVDTLLKLSGPNTEILLSYEERDFGNKPALQKNFLEIGDIPIRCRELIVYPSKEMFSYGVTSSSL